MADTTPATTAKGDLALFQTFVTAVQTLLPANASLAIAGVLYTGPELVTKLQSVMAPLVTEENARQALKTAEDASKAAKEGISTFAASFKDAVKGYLSPGSSQLAQWGIAPRKAPAPLTVNQKVVRTAKMLATRKARGTLGPKEKAKIKVTSVPPQLVTENGSTSVPATSTSTATPSGSSTPPASGSTTASTTAPAASTTP